MSIRPVLGSRASIGGPLGSGRGGAAAQWWLSGGVSAANAIAVYQPIGAASLAASYINLANPGVFDAAPGVAPTWAAATGWTFGGAQYLTTGATPASGWSMIVRYSDATTLSSIIAGSESSTTTRFFLSNSFSGGAGCGYGYGGFTLVGPRLQTGILCVASTNGYRNGTIDTSAVGTWSGTATRSIYIGAYNNGTVAFPFAGKIQAVAIYTATLSAAQVAAISAAMAAL